MHSLYQIGHLVTVSMLMLPSISMSEVSPKEVTSPPVSSGIIAYFVHDFCFSRGQTYEQATGRVVLNPEFFKTENDSYFLRSADLGISLSPMSIDGIFNPEFPFNCVVMFSTSEELTIIKSMLNETVLNIEQSDISLQGGQEVIKIGQGSMLIGSKLEYENGKTFGYFYSQPVAYGDRVFDQIMNLERETE